MVIAVLAFSGRAGVTEVSSAAHSTAIVQNNNAGVIRFFNDGDRGAFINVNGFHIKKGVAIASHQPDTSFVPEPGGRRD